MGSKGIIHQEGFAFSFDPRRCLSCRGDCCRGASGNVWVNADEMRQISARLEMNIIDFIRTCLNRSGNRFTLKERRTGQGFECLFFQEGQRRCAIYPVRPLQCRQYPFWEYFKGQEELVARACPGVLIATPSERSIEPWK